MVYLVYYASCVPEDYSISPKSRYLSLEADDPSYFTGLASCHRSQPVQWLCTENHFL